MITIRHMLGCVCLKKTVTGEQCILLKPLIMLHRNLSIDCSLGSEPVGVQCRLHHRSCSILRIPVECVGFFSAPFFDVVQPFSARSSSPRLSLQHSRYHLLHQPTVLHPAYM